MKKEKHLALFKKHGQYEVFDRFHLIACGTTEQLAKNVLIDHYLPMSFTFEYLQRAEMYFKSIHGDDFNQDRLKMMVPKTKQAPIVFVYNYGDKDQIFAICPRLDVDDMVRDNKT